jgi:hypothetical protein
MAVMNRAIKLWIARGALGLVWGAMAALDAGAAFASPSGHAHVHGHAQLEVSVQGSRLYIALTIPMEVLVGFERAPRSDDERARLDRALELLRAPTLFRPSAAAACRHRSATLSWSSGGPTSLPPEDSHNDLNLVTEFDCAEPAQLAALEAAIFDAFSRLRRIDARVAGSHGSLSAVLQRSKRSLALRR